MISSGAAGSGGAGGSRGASLQFTTPANGIGEFESGWNGGSGAAGSGGGGRGGQGGGGGALAINDPPTGADDYTVTSGQGGAGGVGGAAGQPLTINAYGIDNIGTVSTQGVAGGSGSSGSSATYACTGGNANFPCAGGGGAGGNGGDGGAGGNLKFVYHGLFGSGLGTYATAGGNGGNGGGAGSAAYRTVTNSCFLESGGSPGGGQANIDCSANNGANGLTGNAGASGAVTFTNKAGATISQVQVQSNNCNGPATSAVSLFGVGANHGIILTFVSNSGYAGVSAISDSFGLAGSFHIASKDSSYGFAVVYYLQSTQSHTGTETITFSEPGIDMTVVAIEVNSTIVPVAHGGVSGHAGALSMAMNSTSFTGNPFLVGVYYCAPSTTMSAGSGFTLAPSGDSQGCFGNAEYSASGVASPTAFPAGQSSSNTYYGAGAAFTSGKVVLPLAVCLEETGAASRTFTLSGGSVSPASVTGAFSCSYTNLSVNATATVTIHAPSDGPDSRYRTNASTTTTTVTACSLSVGICGSAVVYFYYELEQTYGISDNGAGPPDWSPGLSAAVTGTVLGVGSTALCTISPTSGTTTTATCQGWEDIGYTATEPSNLSGAGAGTQWAGYGTIWWVDTTGGNTRIGAYYLQTAEHLRGHTKHSLGCRHEHTCYRYAVRSFRPARLHAPDSTRRRSRLLHGLVRRQHPGHSHLAGRRDFKRVLGGLGGKHVHAVHALQHEQRPVRPAHLLHDHDDFFQHDQLHHEHHRGGPSWRRWGRRGDHRDHHNDFSAQPIERDRSSADRLRAGPDQHSALHGGHPGRLRDPVHRRGGRAVEQEEELCRGLWRFRDAVLQRLQLSHSF